MAIFQKAVPRPDTTPRRPITRDDITFLTELQTELNTQDTMGNRDPRYWVIRQKDEAPAPDDACDRVIAVDTDGNTIAYELDEFIEYLLGHLGESFTATKPEDKNYWSIAVTDDGESLTDEYAWSIKDVVDLLHQAGNEDYRAVAIIEHDVTVPDTLFLTHRACEDHLKRYGYNYRANAHAYAMTAVRSPQFERLLTLLQTVDWRAVQAALPTQEKEG